MISRKNSIENIALSGLSNLVSVRTPAYKDDESAHNLDLKAVIRHSINNSQELTPSKKIQNEPNKLNKSIASKNS